MLLVKNRKALFNHEVIEKFLAGIELRGYEVKAIKENNVSFEGSYVDVEEGEVFVKNLHIGKYSRQSQSFSEVDSRRPRRLLLNKNEIIKVQKEITEKGKTAVPLALLLKRGRIKLEFAIVKGRKKHQKKQLLKKRQIEADLKKNLKDQFRLH
jgi:SsrA-binding protein